MSKRKEFNRATEGLAAKFKRINLSCSKSRVAFLSLLKEDLEDVRNGRNEDTYDTVISSIETLLSFIENGMPELKASCGIKNRNPKSTTDLEKEIAKLQKRLENRKAA